MVGISGCLAMDCVIDLVASSHQLTTIFLSQLRDDWRVTHRPGTRLTRECKFISNINGWNALAEGVRVNAWLNRPGDRRRNARALSANSSMISTEGDPTEPGWGRNPPLVGKSTSSPFFAVFLENFLPVRCVAGLVLDRNLLRMAETTGNPTVPDPDVEGLGPAMLALEPGQRRFALAAVMYPLAKDWQIAKAAGYSDRSHGALRVTAHRLFHNERVLAAIRECADKEVRSGAMLGIATIKKIVRNDLHRDQFKAAAWLAGLNGFAVAQNININQTVRDESGSALLGKIEQLAAKLGVPVAGLLGAKPAAPVVDAEFSEVDDGSAL